MIIQKYWKIIAIILLFIISVSIVSQLIKEEPTVTVEELDINCLRNYANDFCGSYPEQVTERDFYCVIENNPRENYVELEGPYLFMNWEIENCTKTTEKEVNK